MKDKLMFAKIRPDAIIPSKRDEDGGYDIYPCFDSDYMVIPAFTNILIPTGLASAFDKKYVMVFRERGSTGTKNLKISAGIVDSGYRNEIFVCLYNGNDFDVTIMKSSKVNETFSKERAEREIKRGNIYPYEKAIAQALMIEVPELEISEITYDELKNISSERNMGNIGSSGK